MKRYLRLAALVAVGFVLLVLSSVVGSLGGLGVPTGLILGAMGFVVFITSGLVYTALFVREFIAPEK